MGKIVSKKMKKNATKTLKPKLNIKEHDVHLKLTGSSASDIIGAVKIRCSINFIAIESVV